MRNPFRRRRSIQTTYTIRTEMADKRVDSFTLHYESTLNIPVPVTIRFDGPHAITLLRYQSEGQ